MIVGVRCWTNRLSPMIYNYLPHTDDTAKTVDNKLTTFSGKIN